MTEESPSVRLKGGELNAAISDAVTKIRRGTRATTYWSIGIWPGYPSSGMLSATNTRPPRVDGAVGLTLAYALGGGALAGLLLLGDSMIEGRGPAVLVLAAEPARALLISLAGAYVAVVAIVFWVRIYAVQLGSGPLTSRVLKMFLVDSVQRHSMAAIVGALAFTLVALRGIPADGSGLEEPPHLAINAATILPVVVAAILVYAIENAAQLGQPGKLVRWLSDRCRSVVYASNPPLGEGTSDPTLPAITDVAGEPLDIRSRDDGWVKTIDRDEILAALGPGEAAEVPTSVGRFLHRGDLLCRVHVSDDHGHDSERKDRIRVAFSVGSEPSIEQDLSYGLNELVDVAERALNPSMSDTTAAREVVFNVGTVLRELLVRDLPSPNRLGEEGRRLVMTGEPSFGDYVGQAFDRIRTRVLASVELARHMLDTIEALEREVVATCGESHERIDPLRFQARRLVEDAEATLPRAEFERLLGGSELGARVHALDTGLQEGLNRPSRLSSSTS